MISIRARKRGTTRFLIGSTPSTCRASSSSRILRAPRSAVIAVPATPATMIALTNGANSRTEARMKKPPRRSRAPNRERKLAACSPGAPKLDRDHRDRHREPAELEREQELADELAAVGIRRPDRRDKSSCRSGSSCSRPARTGSWRAGTPGRRSRRPSACLPANGHPPETLTRHQFISAPSGPIRGPTSQVEHPSSPVSAAETTSHRCPAGSATIASRTSRARRSRRDRRRADSARPGEQGEQRVAGLRELVDAGDPRLGRPRRRLGRLQVAR